MGLTTLRGDALVNAITCASAACFLLFGYDNGVFAGIINTEAFLSQFNYPSSTLTGTIVSIYNLGCFLGCIIAGLVGRRLGRRLTIIASQWVCIIGTILQCTAFTVGHLIVGRIVTGVATGKFGVHQGVCLQLTEPRHGYIYDSHVGQ
jgi:MFS family permease